MSTVVSVKGAKPVTTGDKSNKTAGKRKAGETGGKDSKNKKPKKKA